MQLLGPGRGQLDGKDTWSLLRNGLMIGATAALDHAYAYAYDTPGVLGLTGTIIVAGLLDMLRRAAKDNTQQEQADAASHTTTRR